MLAIFVVVLVVASGVGLRVRELRRQFVDTWHRVLDGGAGTTQATLDDWFAERAADVEGLAATVALHSRMREQGVTPPSFRALAEPLVRRGKFLQMWVVDSSGAVLASSGRDSLRAVERAAALEAIATGEASHSAVMPMGPHAAQMSIAASIPKEAHAARRSAPVPSAVVLRSDIVAAFTPWAVGRANAALSLFSTPGSSANSSILIWVCPEQQPSVCIREVPGLTTRHAEALVKRDTFGLFESFDGGPVLAATRYDRRMRWTMVRRVRLKDAKVPLDTEYYIESAFLTALIAVAALAMFGANRAVRVRRLDEQRHADARLASIVDASTDGLLSLDDQFRITMVNGAVERLTGFRRESLVGQPVFSLFAREWQPVLRESLESFARSSEDHAPLADNERCVARRADGTLVSVDARVRRATIDGDALFVLGLRDVSDRARTERFVQGQRHVLELIAAGAPASETMDALLAVIEGQAPELRCAVYRTDDEGQVARLVSSRGLPRAVSAMTETVVVGLRAGAVGAALHRGESVFSTSVLTETLWGDLGPTLAECGIGAGWAIPLRAGDGQILGALAGYHDEARRPTVRERELLRAAVHLAGIALTGERAAVSLRASEASFRSFVENAPAAIFSETLSGRMVSANPAMLALLDYPDVASLSRASEQGRLYVDASARSRLITALGVTDVVRGVEVEWRRADGSLAAIRLSARAQRDDHGTLQWQGYAEDVTPLRDAEVALRRSERLAAVGQLISGVAHELNNPLSSILHFAEDLLTDDRPREDAEALVMIRDQARRSRAIVRDLLSFVRQRAAQAESMPFDDAVHRAARGLLPEADALGVTMHIEMGRAGYVFADRAGVEQIVVNLASNAAQAARRGGEVWVRTERTETGARLIVEDSGPGIAPDVLPRIFDPFFTTKPTGEGTGLGLSVTLGIVEQYGGHIAVEARQGGTGARFTVFLPAGEEVTVADETTEAEASRTRRNPPAPAPRASAGVRGNGRVALVIDDEESIRGALRRYFTRRGWVVYDASDGAEGMALLEEHGAQVGVVVSDLRMPGMSGIELHDLLAERGSPLLGRMIFSTGDVASAEAANFVERTRCPVLQKPFELRMLDEIIARVDDGATAGDGAVVERVVT